MLSVRSTRSRTRVATSKAAEVQVNPSYMNKVPTEILVYILAFLNTSDDMLSAMMVCRLWYVVLRDRFWNLVTVGVTPLTYQKLGEILIAGESNQALRLTVPQIRNIRLVQAGNTAFRLIAPHCANVRSAEIKDEFAFLRILDKVSSHMTDLESLQLYANSMLTPKTRIPSSIGNLVSLKNLVIHTTGDVDVHILHKGLDSIPNLKTLEITVHRGFFSWSRPKTTSLQFTNIKSLSLRSQEPMTAKNEPIQALIESMPKLEKLLMENLSVAPTILHALLHLVPEVQELSFLLLHNPTDSNLFTFQTCEDVVNVMQAVPNLRSLRIESAAGLMIPPNGDSSLASLRQYCRNLSSLSIASILRIEPSIRLTDFEWMATYNITRLHLVYSTERQRFYSDREARTLSCWWDTYDSRCLRVNSWIDDTGVATLSEYFPHLEDLALHPAPQLVGCKSLWATLGERCPKLRVLNLGYLSSFLPQSVRDLCETSSLMKSLRVLRLHHPPQLDLRDVALFATPGSLTPLEVLEISEGGVEIRSAAWLWERERRWKRMMNKNRKPGNSLDKGELSSQKRRKCFLPVQRRPRSVLRVGSRFEEGCDFGDFAAFLARIAVISWPIGSIDDEDSTSTSRRTSYGDHNLAMEDEEFPEIVDEADAINGLAQSPSPHPTKSKPSAPGSQLLPEVDAKLCKEFSKLKEKVEELFWMDKEEKLECGDIKSIFKSFATWPEPQFSQVDAALLDALCETSLPRMAEDLLDDWIVGDN